MELEINQLIDNEDEVFSNIGWLLYNREDQNGGLSKEEVYKLLGYLNKESLVELRQSYYDEGFNDGEITQSYNSR